MKNLKIIDTCTKYRKQKSTLQISELLFALHPKPLYRAVRRVGFLVLCMSLCDLSTVNVTIQSPHIARHVFLNALQCYVPYRKIQMHSGNQSVQKKDIHFH